MTDTTVAQLDRGSTELHEALSRANGFWDDSRRESTARRYLLPHEEAHDRLQAQLAEVLDAATQARAEARDADLAVAAAHHESEEAQRQIGAAGYPLKEVQEAAEAARRAEGAATYAYANALQLTEEANATAP